MMRRFYLNRSEDTAGVSGTGRVLEGVLTDSGRVMVEWIAPYKTIAVYDTLEQFVALHVQLPHQSELVWVDE
jgi:hypothetical protein